MDSNTCGKCKYYMAEKCCVNPPEYHDNIAAHVSFWAAPPVKSSRCACRMFENRTDADDVVDSAKQHIGDVIEILNRAKYRVNRVERDSAAEALILIGHAINELDTLLAEIITAHNGEGK